MPTLTVRNIPEETLAQLRGISRAERRSVNSEVLMLIDEGVGQRIRELARRRAEERRVDLASRGIDEAGAAELRHRLSTFAEDWSDSTMDIYDEVYGD